MLVVPSTKTLDKYGLTFVLWQHIAALQGYTCGVCGKLPSTGRLHIDHEHVKGFAKLDIWEKRNHVRGLLCWICNHFFARRGMTEEKARRLVKYLVAYAERRANG